MLAPSGRRMKQNSPFKKTIVFLFVSATLTLTLTHFIASWFTQSVRQTQRQICFKWNQSFWLAASVNWSQVQFQMKEEKLFRKIVFFSIFPYWCNIRLVFTTDKSDQFGTTRGSPSVMPSHARRTLSSSIPRMAPSSGTESNIFSLKLRHQQRFIWWTAQKQHKGSGNHGVKRSTQWYEHQYVCVYVCVNSM